MKRMRRFIVGVVSGLLLILLLGAAGGSAQAASNLMVDEDHVECPKATFTSIQDAIDSVPVGGHGTITVCAGTYTTPDSTTPIHIDSMNNLKLIAKGIAVIKLTTDNYDDDIIKVSNSLNVTIQGFYIDGNDKFNAAGANRQAGIAFYNSSGKILKNYIVRIRHSPLDATAKGFPIYIVGTDGGTHKVTVLKNTVYDFQGNGIHAASNATTVLTPTISGNYIQMSLAGGSDPYGIYLRDTRYASITANTVVSDWTYTHAACTSATGECNAGIVVHESSNSKVTGNKVSGTQLGILVAANGLLEPANKNVVTGNTILDVDVGVMVIAWANDAFSPSQDAVARYNKVSGNKISAHSLRGNAGVAVLVQDDSASLGALTQYTTVTGNRSLGFLNGLKGVDDHGEFSVISGNKTGYPPPGS